MMDFGHVCVSRPVSLVILPALYIHIIYLKIAFQSCAKDILCHFFHLLPKIILVGELIGLILGTLGSQLGFFLTFFFRLQFSSSGFKAIQDGAR